MFCSPGLSRVLKMKVTCLFFSVYLFSISFPVGAKEIQPCKYKDSGALVSYDLTGLKDDKALTIQGGDLIDTNAKEETWTYTFAICRNLEKKEIPEVCVKSGVTLDSAVYQTLPGNSSLCTPTGRYITNSDNKFLTNIELYNPDDKSAGVNITYKGGKADCGPKNEFRQFSLHIRCKDVLQVSPVSVFELGKDGRPNQCHYQASIDSILGCPTECGQGQNDKGERSLCSGRGICGFDRTNKRARCFCDEGFRGDSCHEKTPAPTPPSSDSKTSGNSGGATKTLMVLLFLAVAVLFGTVVFLANQIKAYRSDAQNYMQIRGTEMMDQFGPGL